MKFSIAAIGMLLFFAGCAKPDAELQYSSTPQATPTPSQPKPSPTPPKQSVPEALYSCKGSGSFSKIEVWWTKSIPRVPVYRGSLAACENQGRGDGLGMSITFPARGTTLVVNGESRTMWLVALITNQDGFEEKYYQHSEFTTTAEACSMGRFISLDGRVLEVRVHEPRSRQGLLIYNQEKFQLTCSR